MRKGSKVPFRYKMGNTLETKFCPRCKVVKQRTEFYKNRKSPDGNQGYCGKCMNEKRYESIAKKVDHYREMGRRNQAARRINSPEAIKISKRRDYVKRREQILEKNKAWFDAHPGARQRMHQLDGKRRRAREYNAFVEDVERIVLWDRDNGICYLCGDEVSFYKMHMDHVMPISKGGKHSYENMKVAHPDCNQWKHARILEHLPIQVIGSTLPVTTQ